MDYRFPSGDLQLSGHLAVPADGMQGAPGLVVCHGFPTRGRESPQSGLSFPELADRIATELGWLVLTMNFRGCGQAEGDFSLNGWLDDVHAGVAHLRSLGVAAVWLAGFGSGGSLAICEGARNPHVRGVAAMGAQGDFDDWARNPRRLLLHARQTQVIKDPAFPPAFDRWASELRHVRPLEAAADLAPRRLLVIHGDRDDLTPPDDGRALAAAHGSAEFRLISGAGHELRHDPRSIAVFLGWLSRQRISALSPVLPSERTEPVPIVDPKTAGVLADGAGESGDSDTTLHTIDTLHTVDSDGFDGEPTVNMPIVPSLDGRDGAVAGAVGPDLAGSVLDGSAGSDVGEDGGTGGSGGTGEDSGTGGDGGTSGSDPDGSDGPRGSDGT